jgi:UDP-N-acetylmuramoyl-L-alanyl-D-glutamate--2,6-diaminopimelate ligase
MGFRGTVKKFIPKKTFKKIEPYGHLGEAVLLNAINGFPVKGIKVIGVTGTNGKTTTSFLIHRMLHEAGYKVGLMTTVAYGVGDKIKPQKEHMTSVTVPTLIKRVKQMKNEGMEWLVFETTSHALAQHRVWGVPYSVAVFTNLTHEHLDYHGTFAKYRDAKRLMFQMCNANKNGLRTGIVNADDLNAKYFVADVTNPITYGMKDGDLRARAVRLTPAGSRYIVQIDDEEYHIHCRLPGSFNVYNSLAAVGVGRALGLSKEQIQDGIEALEGVEGRMTHVDEGQDFDVIVDYAHTPDSFEKLFKDIKPVVTGKLIVMFGSAGRRDEAKRAVQGELAGKYADEVIITEEDDRDMDGQEIMEQIAEGAEKAGKKRNKDLFLVHDRTEAIMTAINRAKKGDTVMLLGKGHEKDILRNGPRAAELRHLQQDDHNPERVIEVKWDEIATARRALKDRL